MRPRDSSAGFTLLEVMIATMILATSMVALQASWTGTLVSFKKAQKNQEITALLRGKASELEVKYENMNFSEIPESEEGAFEGHNGLKWKAETQEKQYPDLSALTQSDSDEPQDPIKAMLLKQLAEFIPKAVKELRVTVTWTTRTRSVDYAITTYLINYDEPFNIGIGGGGIPGLPGGNE
jgi:prepilin-type N-terminal cleavage/methylation domain-containing protein